MENVPLDKLMRLVDALSIENKLELMSKLSKTLKLDLKSNNNNKEDLLNNLFGAWSKTDENLPDVILKARNISDKDISFN